MQASSAHILFQNYLKEEKEIVQKNLNKKVLPSTAITDYEIIKTIGEGSYGHVVAAKNIHNEKIFALKIINKKYLLKRENLKQLKSEIRILNAVNFQFLISLECYFTNRCNVFIVLPYISGGHFFWLLRKAKKFEESVARFFAGQIVLAIEYLHFMGIIYRDLKPENLLLDLQGYLKVVDYGFAKHIGHKHAYSFCGTPEYIAPEILLSKGYSRSPDWWTLGILLYEMCNGSPPFTGKTDLKIYEKILVGKVLWPQHFSSELKSIVQGLLQVDHTKRLGCMKNKAGDVKCHKWFAQLNWMELWDKKILPPIKYSDMKGAVVENTKKIPSFMNCVSRIHPNAIGNIDVEI